ncbi:LysR family transcriptional regulator [Megasphaera elsdenii]|uniref:LysR family transcriptional regulator n=1 Tax=Megasphaera elsdenii TaxID=907 RepID=UPI003D035E55
MTLRHFRIFLAVCERLSMTEAARQLHISQPSVTQAIHEMENHYGILLFERLGRHIYLTAAGENLKQYAYQILSLCQQAEDSHAALIAYPPGREHHHRRHLPGGAPDVLPQDAA